MISIKSQNESINQKIIDNKQLNDIKHRYDAANSRLIVLDYDGTLAPFVKNPMDAKPSKRLLSLLKKLADDSKNKVIINSGRNREIMDMWFEELDIYFVAEHSAFYKENNKWNQNVIEKHPWNDEIVDIVQHTMDKTPHSTMEIKDAALVWHFRKVDVWLAKLREKK